MELKFTSKPQKRPKRRNFILSKYLIFRIVKVIRRGRAKKTEKSEVQNVKIRRGCYGFTDIIEQNKIFVQVWGDFRPVCRR